MHVRGTWTWIWRWNVVQTGPRVWLHCEEETNMKAWLARKKYQFEAITSLTMLEPAEKRALCILTS